MNEGIKLVRVDFRLIHGQVITKWTRAVAASRIIVVNDELAADEFMADVYAMAAPPGMVVDVVTLESFVASSASGDFATGRILVLFKSIEDAASVVDAGVAFKDLQIGGLGSGGGKTSVVRGISIDKDDAALLGRIEISGTPVSFQVTPEEPQLSLDKAVKKLK